MKLSQKFIRRIARRYLQSRGFQLPREFYLPPDVRKSRPYKPKGTDLEIYAYESPGPDGKTVFYAAAFQGRAQKPLWHYRFKDENHRERVIKNLVEARKKALQEKIQRREEQKQFQHGIKEGDIFVASWGYDQTNIDFYQVVRVQPKMVVIRKLVEKIIGSSGVYDRVVPVKNKFVGPPLKKRPMKGMGGKPYINISRHITAFPWDGRPREETNPVYGH